MGNRLLSGNANMAGGGSGGGGVPPNAIPGLSLWLRADQGITTGGVGTFVHSGTGPGISSVTFTGAPLGSLVDIAINIIATGVVGTSTFEYSVNGGAFSAPQVTGSGIALTGTGVSVTFAAGTYEATDSYAALPTVLDWTSIDGSATVFTQATLADQPGITPSGINNLPSLIFNGTTDVLAAAGYAAFSAPWTVFVVGKMLAQPTAQGILIADTAADWQLGVNDSPPVFWYVYAGLEVLLEPATFTSGFCLSGLLNGTSSRMPANATYLAATGTNTSAGGLSLGAYSGGADYYPGLIAEVILYKRGLSVTESSSVLEYVATRYAL